MKNFTPIIALAALSLAVLFSIGISHSTSALSLMEGVNAARGNNVPGGLFGSTGIVSQIINTLLFIVGALSVIMIIFGGLRYVTSAGNSSAVTAAKNTILYAIVGLIISFLAFAAVNFVLGAVGSSVGGGGAFESTNL